MALETRRHEPSPEINNETLQRALVTANELLAQKGTSEEVIAHLNKYYKAAARLRNFSWIVEADQVKFFAGEHMMMEGDRNLKLPRVQRGVVVMGLAQLHMETTARKNKNSVREDLFIRLNLFRGKIAEGMKQFGLAEFFYKQGAEEFEKSTSPNPSYMRHELKGRAVHAMFQQGRVEEAVTEVKNVLDGFEKDGDALWHRSVPDKNGRTGYVSKVWNAGIRIRTAEDLMDNNALHHKDFISYLLKSSDNILVLEEDGDRTPFVHRLAELDHAKKRFDSIFNK